MSEPEWGALLRLAWLRFGLNPAEFWALSVREWQWLTRSDPDYHLKREGLQELMQAFPDEDNP